MSLLMGHETDMRRCRLESAMRVRSQSLQKPFSHSVGRHADLTPPTEAANAGGGPGGN